MQKISIIEKLNRVNISLSERVLVCVCCETVGTQFIDINICVCVSDCVYFSNQNSTAKIHKNNSHLIMTTYTSPCNEHDFTTSRICSTESYYEPNGPFYAQLYPADSQQTDSKN